MHFRSTDSSSHPSAHTPSAHNPDQLINKKPRIEQPLTPVNLAPPQPQPFTLQVVVRQQDNAWTLVEVRSDLQTMEEGRRAFARLAFRVLGVQVTFQDSVWVLIPSVAPEILTLVNLFNLLSDAVRCSGAQVDMLSSLMEHESPILLFQLVQSRILGFEPQSGRLLWQTTEKQYENLQRLMVGMTQPKPDGTKNPFGGIALHTLADLLEPMHSSLKCQMHFQRLLEIDIAKLLSSWLKNEITGEVFSILRWINTLVNAPERRRDPIPEELPLERLKYLKKLHRCSCGQEGLSEVAQWALQKAKEMKLDEVKDWVANPAQTAQTPFHMPRHDPNPPGAMGHLQLATTQAPDKGLIAAQDLTQKLDCPSLIHQLIQARSILQLLTVPIVVLQPVPGQQVSPGIAPPLQWGIIDPIPPEASSDIVALAKLLSNTSPDLAPKAVELLFAARRANPDATGHQRLCEGLLDIAASLHHAQPAIFRFPSWHSVLSQALSRNPSPRQQHIGATPPRMAEAMERRSLRPAPGRRRAAARARLPAAEPAHPGKSKPLRQMHRIPVHRSSPQPEAGRCSMGRMGAGHPEPIAGPGRACRPPALPRGHSTASRNHRVGSATFPKGESARPLAVPFPGLCRAWRPPAPFALEIRPSSSAHPSPGAHGRPHQTGRRSA